MPEIYPRGHEKTLRKITSTFFAGSEYRAQIETLIDHYDFLSAEKLIIETMEKLLHNGSIETKTANEIVSSICLSLKEVVSIRAQSAQLY